MRRLKEVYTHREESARDVCVCVVVRGGLICSYYNLLASVCDSREREREHSDSSLASLVFLAGSLDSIHGTQQQGNLETKRRLIICEDLFEMKSPWSYWMGMRGADWSHRTSKMLLRSHFSFFFYSLSL